MRIIVLLSALLGADGGIDQSSINEVVRSHQKTLTACLKEIYRPGVVQKIPIEFEIGNDGRVTRVWVDHPDYKSGAFPDCLLRKLQTWPFKPFTGEHPTVSLSFNVGKSDTGGESGPATDPRPVPDRKAELAQSAVMEVVLAHKADLGRCADEQHKADPSASGKLVMRWRVLADGHVGGVDIVSAEYRDTVMAGCLTRQIKSWVFPRSTAPESSVEFPFKF